MGNRHIYARLIGATDRRVMRNRKGKQKLRALIADTDPAFREKLRDMIRAYPDLEVCGTTGSAKRTLRILREEPPDILFLDVRLDGADGFDIAREAPAETRIVFDAPTGDYALLAFRSNALDYLVKPLTPGRLAQTLGRLREEQTLPDNAVTRRHGYDDPLFLSTAKKTAFCRISRILYVRAEGDYSKLHTVNRESFLLLRTMKEWEALLPSNHFLRIHRSTIINSNYIENVQKESSGNFRISLKGIEKPFTMSRRFAVRLRRHLR